MQVASDDNGTTTRAAGGRDREPRSGGDGRICVVWGIALIIIGVFGFVSSSALSARAYRRNDPLGSDLRLSPTPGTGDVPRWISGVYLLSLLVGVAGIVVVVVSALR